MIGHNLRHPTMLALILERIKECKEWLRRTDSESQSANFFLR